MALGLRAHYIHRIYSVGRLWGNVKKSYGDLSFLYQKYNEVLNMGIWWWQAKMGYS